MKQSWMIKTDNNKMTERNYKMDNLKALLIFLVVFGHLLENFGGEFRWRLYLMIYSFHMPFFAYITGYFSRFDPERLMKNLIYPYCVYQIIYLLFQRFCLEQENMIQFTTPYWLLWYLMANVIWMLLIPLMSQSKISDRNIIRIMFLIALVIGLDKSVGYYLSLSRMIVLLPFFAAGYLRVLEKINRWGVFPCRYAA